MMIRYWQPFREIETLRRQIDQAFEDLSHVGEAQDSWMPAVELKDAGDNLVLRAQLPGIAANDLDVQVTREAVSLAGEHRYEAQTQDHAVFRSEFRYGKFQRVIPLPVAVQNDQVQAAFKDGILTLTLPKVTEARNKVVKINLGEISPNSTTATLKSGGESER